MTPEQIVSFYKTADKTQRDAIRAELKNIDSSYVDPRAGGGGTDEDYDRILELVKKISG